MKARRHEMAPLSAAVPHYVTTAEAGLWDLDGPDGADRLWRRPILSGLPEDFAERFAQRYRHTWGREGRTAANTELRELTEGLTRNSLKLSASDQVVRDKAAACAQACARLAARQSDPQRQYEAVAHYVLAQGLVPPRVHTDNPNPNPNGYGNGLDGGTVTDTKAAPGADTSASEIRPAAGGYTLAGAVARMSCPRWWRRALRRELGRRIEHHAIRFGFVHRRAAKYVSDDTLRRIRQQWRLNEIALASVELENEDGEVLSLEDLVERSNANPYVRRSELMVRMAGFEKFSASVGSVGVFLTLTCPSRFHARYAQSGDANPQYDDRTPRQAQRYLCKLWSQIRAACQRQGLNPYGIRVAEPHHDGTPHWHLLVFIQPEQKAAFVALCRQYALKDSPDEPGALKQRFQAVDIDHKKGTATGYIAKYISKNIDGHGLEADEDGYEITGSAERVRAWASTWGIRQFQFFGGPPVAVWRELRRLPDAVYGSETLEKARAAADAGDWQAYMTIMGGVGCKRQAQPVKLATQWSDKESVYGEPLGELVFGVQCGQVTVETRFHVWATVQKSKTQTEPTTVRPYVDVDINVYGAGLPIRIGNESAAEEDRGAVYVGKAPGSPAPYTDTSLYTDGSVAGCESGPKGWGWGDLESCQ